MSKAVTRAECERCNNAIMGELTTIKNALIGEDLRSGLVAEIADLKSQIKVLCGQRDTALKERDQSKERALRWKIATFGAIISATLFILGRLF